MTRRRFLYTFAALFIATGYLAPAFLIACQPAKTAADILEGAACGLAYAELGKMPPGCNIPVPMLRQRADALEKVAKETKETDASNASDASADP